MINPELIFHPAPMSFSIPIIRFYGLVYGAEACAHAMHMLSI